MTSFWDEVKHGAEVIVDAAEDSASHAWDVAEHGIAAEGLVLAAGAEFFVSDLAYTAGWGMEHVDLPDEAHATREASDALFEAGMSDAGAAITELREGIDEL